MYLYSIFDGAAFTFFSFIGFDCVSTLAEEVKNPALDMPVRGFLDA
jgi:amino acid transporter